MRKKMLIIPFCTICLSVLAQSTLNLNTMYISDGIYNTLPTRDIEYDSDGVTITYHFNNISLNKDPLFDSTLTIIIDGFWPNHNTGEPAILTKWDTFVIPDGKSKLLLLDSTVVEFPLELSPARPILSNYSYEEYTKDNVRPITAYKGYFPSALVPATRMNVFRNKTLFEVCICPVKYDYQNRKVRFYKDIKYKICYNTGLNNEETYTNPTDNSTDTFLNNIALNVSSNTSKKSRALFSPNILLPNSHYLIITVPKYSEAANRLAEWKRTLGFDVQIVTQATWTTTQIKNTIQNAYNTNNIEYVLILGGHSDVPAQYSSLKISHYTDLYYGGQTTGYTPSIYRGRIPVNTSDEANNVINKIVNYEKHPSTATSMYNMGINCAYFQNGNPSGYEAILIGTMVLGRMASLFRTN